MDVLKQPEGSVLVILLILSLIMNVFLSNPWSSTSGVNEIQTFKPEYLQLKKTEAVQVKSIDSLKSEIQVLKDSLKLKIIHTKTTNTHYEKRIKKAIAIRNIDSLSTTFISNAYR